MIRFGTDGWRGLIADDFTFENVRLVARALACYVQKHENPAAGVVVGHDTRFGGERFAAAAAEELARAGIPTLVAGAPTPTPVVSYAVRHFRAAGGVMITASHNPWQWNGVKFKAAYGGSASPAIVKKIEAEVGQAFTPVQTPAKTCETDLRTPYLEHLRGLVNLEAIARSGRRFVVDPLYGAGIGYVTALLKAEEIHAHRDPLFPGLNPEPIEPHISELRRTVLEGRYDAGFALDGDADRLGAVDSTGAFVDSHRIFSILLEHRARRGERGEVAKTFSTTKMVDRIAARYGMLCHETPIGFKYICDLMLERDILIGGEESGGIGVRGHLPERDGILNCLLLAEVMAERNLTLGELVAELHAQYGPQYYDRRDLHLAEGQKERAIESFTGRPPARIAGLAVTATENKDGIKFLSGDTAWVLLRASGTEPLLRIYSEAPSPELVKALLDEVENLVRSA